MKLGAQQKPARHQQAAHQQRDQNLGATRRCSDPHRGAHPSGRCTGALITADGRYQRACLGGRLHIEVARQSPFELLIGVDRSRAVSHPIQTVDQSSDRGLVKG